VDDDPAAAIVGFDPRDPSLLGLREGFGADDAGVEGGADRVDPEQPFDREAEVGGLDRRPVGVLQPRPQVERVAPAALVDPRQPLGEAGDQLRPGGAVRVRVGEQRRVDVLQRGRAFEREGEAGVKRFRKSRVGAGQGAAFGVAARPAAEQQDDDPDPDDPEACDLRQLLHPDSPS
jgi:hypothetical protein